MGWLQRYRPSSPRTTRLLVAGVLWSAVGTGLLAAGVSWMLADPPRWLWLGLAATLVAGWAKGHFVLSRRAERNAQRILATDDDRCLGGAFSWPAWIFVAVMMAAGAALRRSSVPRSWLGLVYAAVGAALILASTVSWRHWLRLRRAIGGPAV